MYKNVEELIHKCKEIRRASDPEKDIHVTIPGATYSVPHGCTSCEHGLRRENGVVTICDMLDSSHKMPFEDSWKSGAYIVCLTRPEEK